MVGVARVAPVRVGAGARALVAVEARRELARHRLVGGPAVVARQPDRSLVEPDRIRDPAFKSRRFGFDQHVGAGVVGGAVVGPDRELAAVHRQRVRELPSMRRVGALP